MSEPKNKPISHMLHVIIEGDEEAVAIPRCPDEEPSSFSQHRPGETTGTHLVIETGETDQSETKPEP